MFPTYVSVRAGEDIKKDEHVTVELVNGEVTAYTAESEFERLLLPVAIEDAAEGCILAIQS